MADFDINLVIKDGQAIGQIRQVRSELDATEKKATSVRSVLTGLFAGFGVYRVAQEFIELANTSGVLDNRLKLATGSVAGASAAFERLRDISEETRSPLEENVALFQRVSQAQKELGASNEQLYTFVKATGTALAIQGGSAATARGALIQLSQTIGGTIVHAEEFNSILDGALPLAQAAARGIDEAGGSVARLRQLVVEGKISSKEFFDAIIEQAPSLQAAFEQTNATIGQSFIVLKNNVLTAFREFDQATGATAALANSIILLSENLDILAIALTAAGVGFAVFKLTPIIIGVVSFIATIVEFTSALGVAATASLYFSQAIGYIRVAGLALIATPLGIWLAAIAVAGTALYLIFRDTADGADDTTVAMDSLTEAMRNFRDQGGAAAAQTALDIAHNNQEIARTAIEAKEQEIQLQQTLSQRSSLVSNAMGDGAGGEEYQTPYVQQLNAELDNTRIMLDAIVYREKAAVQEIIAAAEAQQKWLEYARYTTPEIQKQYEYYGKTRIESEEQLRTGKEMLQNYQQEAALQQVIAKYGSDSYQAVKLRNSYEIASLRTQLQTLGVSEAMKNQIIQAAIAAQQLGSMNVSGVFEIAIGVVNRLTGGLLAAAAAAASIRIPGITGAVSGIAGSISNFGSRIAGAAQNYYNANKDKYNPDGTLKGTGGSGGGGASETFESQYEAMQKQITAFGELNKNQGLYNKITEISGQINRNLTESELALVEAAYNKIQMLEKEQKIYGELHAGAIDYGTSIAALNDLQSKGAITASEYALGLSKIKLVQDLSNLDKEIGGNFDHAAQLQEVQNQLAERSNIIAQAREADLITEQQYQDRVAAIQRAAHLEAVNVEAARWDFAIQSASSSIDLILGYLKDQGQEQSGIYKAMFIAQKAFAIAEATVNTARAVTNALAAPFPPPIPQTLATIAAVAGGAQIAAIVATAITGLAGGGPVRGPGGDTDDKAGLFALSNNEYVINARAAKANRPILDAINRGQDISGFLAKGGMVNTTNVELKNTGSSDVEKATDTKPSTSQAAPPADVNLAVINVATKEEALATMASQQGTRIYLNTIEAERDTVRSILGIS